MTIWHYLKYIDIITVPRRNANCIVSMSNTGTQHSAIRHFCVTSKLNKFKV